MAYKIDTSSVIWLVGGQVEAAKAAMRQIDTQYCIKILEDDQLITLKKWALMEYIRTCLANVTISPNDKINNNDLSQSLLTILNLIRESYNNNNKRMELHNNLERELNNLNNFSVSPSNVLSVGDFTRAFADIIDHAAALVPEGGQRNNNILVQINAIRRALQDNNAFNKKTNRIRVKRWDVNNRLPSLGINNWRLPPEDVLGAIDRLYGYYECGDISGSTTDAVFSHSVLDCCTAQQGDFTVVNLKKAINTFIKGGNGMVALAPIVAQMHHSLPECMMALNLMPEIHSNNGDNGYIDYSPFLTHVLQFEDNKQIAKHMREWRRARTIAFNSSQYDLKKGHFRTLIVLQDIYQMANAPDSKNEVAITFSFTYGSTNSSPFDFYKGFYNEIVSILKTNPFGPAIPLCKLAGALINYSNTFSNFGQIEFLKNGEAMNALNTQAATKNINNITGYSQSMKKFEIQGV